MQQITRWIIGILIFVGGIFFVYWAAIGPAPVEKDPIPQITAVDWIKGTLDDSKVQIVEYSDFECPACAAYRTLLDEVHTQYNDKVVIAYRHFPLPKHTNATIAAQASEAAGKQGKFWEMHDLIFENQETWVEQSRTEAENSFKQYGETIGLDLTQYEADFGTNEIAQKIAEQFITGSKAGIQWTPSIFVNGVLLKENPSSPAEFLTVIDNALSE